MDTKWLESFEKKVEAAAAEIRKLRKENAAQQARIEQLQAELDAGAESDDQAAAWEDERNEIRQRVERLSQGLEKLL